LNEDDVRSARTPAVDTASQVDGRSTTAGRGTQSVVGGAGGGGEEPDNDEDDINDMLQNMGEHEKLEAEEDEKRRERLADVLDPDAYNRYNQWRALSLPVGTVRRLVNSIVSQSVTAAPLQATRIYGKWFVGEIVERAREVQQEWAKAYDVTREVEKEDRQKELEALEEKQKAGNTTDQQSRSIAKDVERLKREVKEYIPNPHRGGLLPDHLREALRRYKADGEGGGVGFEGLSHGLLGIGGSAAWRVGDGATGRRLFR
jgi:transcription initiation factor TFIID subunit 11